MERGHKVSRMDKKKDGERERGKKGRNKGGENGESLRSERERSKTTGERAASDGQDNTKN